MNTTIVKAETRPGQRVIVMSDIHGHLDYMIQLLRKVNYSGDDVLVIDGDLVDKGPDSLGTVRYVMDLCRQNQVYVTLGNVDLHRLELLTDESEGADVRFLGFVRWLKEYWGGGLIPDMLADLGITDEKLTEETAAAYRIQLRKHFREEIDFMQSLPVILDMGRYIFVHGGIPTDNLPELEGRDAEEFLKNDNFMEKGYRFSRYVVVGHWPVCLYGKGYEKLSPVFSREQNIISIDGGCGVKQSGQLNALIIPGAGADMEEISWEFYDGLPVVTARERQEAAPAAVHIQYFDNQVEALEERGDVGLFRHLTTGKTFIAPLEHISRDEQGALHCEDYCDARLEVNPGDRLVVVRRTAAGCYVKKDGLMGWYCGRYDELPAALNPVPGRPRTLKERRPREISVYDLLDRLSIPFSRVDHREAKTMAVCKAIDEALDAVICKNLFLRNQQKTRFYLLMMPGDKKFKTRELSRQINSARLSFAEPEYMEQFLHTAPGSVSVMGLMNDEDNQVQLLMDTDVLKGEFFGCHPCVNTSSIRMRLKDLTEIFLPAVHHEPMYVELRGNG